MSDKQWAVCLVDSSITYGPDSDYIYLESVAIAAEAEALLKYAAGVFVEENVVGEDITMVEADTFGKCLVMFRGVVFAKVYTGQSRFKLCEEHDLPQPVIYDTSDDVGRAMADAQAILEKHGVAKVSGQEWFQALSDYAAKTQDPDLFMIIDSVPEDFPKVGDTHVIVPNADNVTDDMLEATRNLLLYTDTFGTIDSEYVKKAMGRRKWTQDNFPTWFNEYRGHLTKDARAHLAYSLTLSAYTNPPAPTEKYFPEVNARELRFVPSKYGCKLAIIHDGHTLDITREFESWRDHVKHGDLFDLQINRHQLPEYWRKMFKKKAIEVSGVIRKDNADGEISLENARVHLGLKNEHAGSVTHVFEKSVKIPKGF
jgi:hypothetical protein